jgi:hypothetical protein
MSQQQVISDNLQKQITDLVTVFQKNPNNVQDFIAKLFSILNIGQQPPTTGGGPSQPPGSDIGPDGVAMMFPENKNAKVKPFYINLDNPDENGEVFACTYGGDLVTFEGPKTEGNIKFVRNKGHIQKYQSGAPDGKSCRFHITPDGGMFGVGKHSWEDTPLPQYLYSEKCFYSFEMTAIVRVGPSLGTHQSFAFKLASRPDKPDDKLRSTIEFCMPNDQKPEPFVNYNYSHKSYEHVDGVRKLASEGKIIENKWIGVKVVFVITEDRKSTWMGMYVNTNPIGQDGQPDNTGWKFKAQYTAKGIVQYKNIPPVWGGMTNYLRIDGYEYVDLYRFSQVEIDTEAFWKKINSDGSQGSSQELEEVPGAEAQMILNPEIDA